MEKFPVTLCKIIATFLMILFVYDGNVIIYFAAIHIYLICFILRLQKPPKIDRKLYGHVIRDGMEFDVLIKNIVPGDLIVIKQG